MAVPEDMFIRYMPARFIFMWLMFICAQAGAQIVIMINSRLRMTHSGSISMKGNREVDQIRRTGGAPGGRKRISSIGEAKAKLLGSGSGILTQAKGTIIGA